MSDEVKTSAELEADKAEAELEGAGPVIEIFTPPAPEEEEVPAEPAPEPTPEEGGATTPPAEGDGTEEEEEEEELPKPVDGKPNPSDWEKVHEVVRNLKAKIKEIEATKAMSTPEPVVPVKAEPDVSDDDVFTIAVDAQVDKFNDPAKSKSLLKQAQDLIDEMTPERVLSVIKKAKSGEFGDNSADVLIMARDALQESTARELVNSKVSATEQQKREEMNKVVASSFERVGKKYPELNDKNNPALMEHAKKWRETNLGETNEKGELVKPGPLASILVSTTEWPELVAEMIVNSFKASGGVINKPTGTKQTEYVPDAGTKKSDGDTPKASDAGDLERRLAKMGNIRKG